MHIGIDARMYGIAHRGLGRYVQKLINGLSKLEDNNRYTLFALPPAAETLANLGGKFKIVPTNVKWYGVREHLSLPKLITKSGVELMHWPHINVPYRCPVPYVLTVHDLIMLHFPDRRATTLPGWRYKIKFWAYRRVLKNAIARSRHILTVSNFTKRDLLRHFPIDEKKITVTYPGVDKMVLGTERLPNLPPFTEYLRASFGINKPYLLYVGSAYPHKNLERLIAAWLILRAKYQRYWQLVLVGRPDYFYEQLKKFIQAAIPDEAVRRDVILAGEVNDKDLDGFYRGARLFVFPSLYEGFGLPPLEAMQRGVPVIAAKAGALPEVLGDAAYYVDPENTEHMAMALDLAGAQKKMQAELAQKGFERSTHFSWENMARLTVETYHRPPPGFVV